MESSPATAAAAADGSAAADDDGSAAADADNAAAGTAISSAAADNDGGVAAEAVTGGGAVTAGGGGKGPAVVIVGAGPAGLFAALELVEAGMRPIIVERGMSVWECSYANIVATLRPFFPLFLSFNPLKTALTVWGH